MVVRSGAATHTWMTVFVIRKLFTRKKLFQFFFLVKRERAFFPRGAHADAPLVAMTLVLGDAQTRAAGGAWWGGEWGWRTHHRSKNMRGREGWKRAALGGAAIWEGTTSAAAGKTAPPQKKLSQFSFFFPRFE